MSVQVSVIIPIYNSAALLSSLFHSLLAQSYDKAYWNLYLIDNHSQDDSLKQLIHFQQQAKAHNLTVQVLKETAIQSSYAARNRGICSATGTILAFTDADCRPHPHWLEQMVIPFSNPSVGIVAGEIAAVPGGNWIEAYAMRHAFLSQTHTLSHPFLPYGQTANLAVRRSAIAQVGLFRPYITTGGDADLCWRILQRGNWAIEVAPQAIVHHRHRSTLQGLAQQWQRYGASNRYLHELYGVPLMPSLHWTAFVRGIGRWWLKTLPTAGIARLRGQPMVSSLIDPMLDWYCRRSRWQGQQRAHLPLGDRLIPPYLPRRIDKTQSHPCFKSDDEV
ncbi:glycosyltransferase [Leptolyngbya sp. AN02str]|uniref:glycosyltransferase n=1 Tax=Leptolyngbya sp. AN02str TaxID=3423363 RepID=UPI003D31F4C2